MGLSTLYSPIFFLLLITTTTTANATADTENEADHVNEYFPHIKTVTRNSIIRLHFYFHETFGETSIVVARAENSSSSNSTFGNISVFDNVLATGTNILTSRLLGKAQGFDGTMKDESIILPLNFVFTAGPFKGSTLALFGRVESSGVSERSVIGGTGQFRGATGYATSEVVMTPAPNYIVVEFDVYVKTDYDFDDFVGE